MSILVVIYIFNKFFFRPQGQTPPSKGLGNNNRWIISVYKAQIHWQHWNFSNGCRRHPSRQHTFNPPPQREICQILSPAFFLCAFWFIYIFHECFRFVKSQGHRGGKKPKWWCTALHEKRRAKGFKDAKLVQCSESLKENENWIVEATAHFYTSHGMCMCGGESKTFVWVMENHTDALSFICLSVCRCFRVWVFFCWTETILT